MNDMLELLAHKINTDADLVNKTRVRGTALIPKILQAYRAADSGTYWLAHDLRWIRDVADDLIQSRAALITSAHLGPITNEPHWVAIVFDCRDKPWWLGQHTPVPVAFADLPITPQADGHSCGILVNNAHEHFVDPSIPLAPPAYVANSRLEVFKSIATRGLEELEIEKACAIAEDKDSPDERSDCSTATPASSSDIASSPAPVPLRRLARDTKFMFTPLLSSSSAAPSPPSSSPAHKISSKRPKGHPDAPTPNPSPEKRRIFKRRSVDSLAPPPQPVFTAVATPSHQTTEVDVFGPVTQRREQDGYGSDSDSESGGEREENHNEDDGYHWGPEDNAPGPPESQMSPDISPSDSPMHPDDDPSYHNLPPLQDVTDSEASDSDENGTPPPLPAERKPTPHPQPHKSATAGKITSFWKVESPEEKAVRLERDGRKYTERGEQVRLREVEEKRKKMARECVLAKERMQRYRDRLREEKMAEGWVPGKKRKRVDLLDHNNTTGPDPRLAELTRPRRDFKEDARKNNKPGGRKRKNQKRNAKYVNWQTPMLWSQIEAAARRTLPPWSPRAILSELRKTNSKDFQRLKEQVIGRWIEQEAGISRWKESVRQKAELGKGNSPGGNITRCGVLHPYPETRKKINDHLTSLRTAGVALTLLTIRGIMVSHIEHDAPEVFERTMGDGSNFHCSESFVRRYLRNTLGWSERRATKAAQKLPQNHEKLLEEAFFRQAHVIRDYAVPAALIVNTDQTQLVYQQGTGSTWTQRGQKQVAIVGQEEKRAFTLVPSISASGKLLGMQAVFQGQTSLSCPSPKAPQYSKAIDLGYTMLPSKTSTYWCTHNTMHLLVNTIIAPYFDAMKAELGLPPSQVSIWLIDLWSVHRSQEFRDWMRKNHPMIIILYVPGGCTGVWQPLDVGIQRLMKLSIKRAAHRDIVDEVLSQIKAGKSPHEIKLDMTVGTLRDRSVGWVVQAIHDINDPAMITRAFEMCRVGKWNLSYASLTSPEALAGLRDLRKTNPALHEALTQTSATDLPVVDSTEEEAYTTREVYDDCDIPLDVVSDHLLSGHSAVTKNFAIADDGGISRSGNAEASDAEDNEESVDAVPLVLGRGQRKKIPARRYLGPIWEEH
ncbi:DDE superfamily endonuclease [Mycena sanguinolenta]|uniref:DDE superfamily endonuclease n=1 Tax=Mycena sanguinolenta TaxID=230812 RepID=A0A8H6YSV6_9AGAR|nr:DDE superfamily endonuclease [Mycena sanguinolenta]